MTVLLAKTQVRVEIAPGQTVQAQLPRDAVPRYGIVQLMRQTDGNYAPVLKTWAETVRLTQDLLPKLGLDVSYNTVRRLITGGFLRGSLIAPETFLLDLESLYDHIEATRDPLFWTEERKAKYREGFRHQIT